MILDMVSALKAAYSSGERNMCTQIVIGRKTRKGLYPTAKIPNHMML